MYNLWNKFKEKAIAIVEEQIQNLEGKFNEEAEPVPSLQEDPWENQGGQKRGSSVCDSNIETKRWCPSSEEIYKEFESFERNLTPELQQTSQFDSNQSSQSVEQSVIGWGLDTEISKEDPEKDKEKTKEDQSQPPRIKISREEALICKKCKKSSDSFFARDFAFHMSKHTSQLYRLHCGSCPFKQTSDKKMALHWVDDHKRAPASKPKDMMSPEMRINYERLAQQCFPDSMELILEWCDNPITWDDDDIVEQRIKGFTRCQVELCGLVTQISLQGLLKHVATHIDYKLYFCGVCNQGVTSIQAGSRHLAYQHENVKNESDIFITTNRSPEFFRDLRRAIAVCFPSMRAQFEDNLEFVFCGAKDLRDKPLIEWKKRRRELEILSSVGAKNQGLNDPIPVINQPKRRRRVVKDKGKQGDPQTTLVSIDRNDIQTTSMHCTSNQSSLSDNSSIGHYYGVPQEFDPNESIYMPNFLVNETGDPTFNPLNMDPDIDPNYQYLFL